MKKEQTLDEFNYKNYLSSFSKEELICKLTRMRTVSFMAFMVLLIMVSIPILVLAYQSDHSISEDFASGLSSKICELSERGEYVTSLRYDSAIVVKCMEGNVIWSFKGD